jgi:hypothetical protein
MFEKYSLINMIKEYNNKVENFDESKKSGFSPITLLVSILLQLAIFIWAISALVINRYILTPPLFWICVFALFLTTGYDVPPGSGSIITLIIVYSYIYSPQISETLFPNSRVSAPLGFRFY